MKTVFDQLRSLPRRDKVRLAWDIFMVWVALINLWMIVFDLTYLWLRPYYFRYVPVITRLYDPVKGIEPHPLTGQFLEVISETRTLVARDPDSPEVANRVELLRELTARILLENPFERSGQTATYQTIVQEVARSVGVTPGALRNPAQLRRALTVLWPDDPVELRYRLDHLDPAFIRNLELNYHREFDRGGHLTDHFWKLDLPFLLLFWVEFLGRWYLAIRRREHARWYFFPIFNWYDVLGLLPTAYFRPFRLLRLVSVYMRLRRSDLSKIGTDFFSRTVAYFSNIITEEVSDRVALRILSEVEEELADGTHVRIARSVIEPRRAEIERVIVDQLATVITNRTTLDRFRELVLLNLETAIEESESLRNLPLPHVVVRPIVRTVGEVLVDSALETVQSTFESEEGREAVRGVVTSVLDDVLSGPGPLELEPLLREIALQVISHMKEVVAVKKWALPEEQGARTPFPWEVHDGGDGEHRTGPEDEATDSRTPDGNPHED